MAKGLSISNCSAPIVVDDGTSNSLSSFTAHPSSIPADGSTTSTITVTLLDASSHPVSGRNVSVNSSRGSMDTITATSATTDSSGQAFFTLKSTRMGLAALTVSIASDLVTLNQLGHVTLLAPGATPQTDYQAWLADAGLNPGSNSRPTSSFKNLTELANTNDGTLDHFGYTTSAGWSGEWKLNHLGRART